MPARLPIGSSDFAQIRREGLHYVDKTALVADDLRPLFDGLAVAEAGAVLELKVIDTRRGRGPRLVLGRGV